MRRDPAEGGGAGGTPWEMYDVEAIGRMLAGQGGATQWRHAIAWRKAAELAADHAGRVRVHRNKLAAAWPPSRSAAAEAYLGRLDAILARTDQIHEQAAVNLKVYSASLDAIHQAQNDLAPIREKYAAAPKGTPEQEELNERARTVMRRLGAELIAAKMHLREPPKPAEFPVLDVEGSPGGGNPPPIPRPRSRTVSTGVDGAAGSGLASSLPSGETGPSLGGVIGPVSVPPTPASSLPVLPSGESRPATPLPPPAGLGLPPQVSRLGPDRPARITAGAQVRMEFPPGHGSPTGGVIRPIGGTPAGPAYRDTEPTVRRVNPVGGVVGTAPSEGGQPLMGSTGGVAGAGHRSGRPHQRWTLESPWEVRRGGPSVIAPADEPGPHDPGPAIGLER